MPYHVYVFERFANSRGRGTTGQGYYFKNLTEVQLRERIVDQWDRGASMTWDGRTADSRRALNITVFETEDAIPVSAEASDAYRLMQEGTDVTNSWISGPAGHREEAQLSGESLWQDARDARRVMVVYGRNAAARAAMFIFLRAIGLDPVEWEDAVAATGVGSPHNLTAVRAAMNVAQAVVVILTAEDRAGLIPEIGDARPDETVLRGQPRQNVTLEAGMAMGVDPDRTILVQLGDIRGASDFDGLNRVNLANDPESRRSLARRLSTAGCAVDDHGTDWLTSSTGGDFGSVALPFEQVGVGSLDDVMALPSVDMRGGQRAELNLRCFRLPERASVNCIITLPDGEQREASVEGYSVGQEQTLHSVAFPDDFPGSPVMAGHHGVLWVASAGDDGVHRELVTTSFRFP